MKISEINVKNFRGIKNLTIRLSNFTILIGKNGVGKSSILHALNFFKQQKYDLNIEDYYNKDLTNQIKVSITFFNLSEAEKEEFQPYIQEDKLRVIKIAKGDINTDNPKFSQKYHGVKKMHRRFTEIRDISDSKPQQKNLYHKLITQEKYNSLSRVSRADQIEDQLSSWEEAHTDELELIMDNGQFFGWPGVGTGKLGKYMDFFFVPAVHEYSEEEKAEGSTYLNELIDLTIRRTYTDTTELNDFIDDVKSQYQQHIDNETKPKTSALSQELSERIHHFAPECEVFIRHQSGEVKFSPTKYETELKEFGFQGPISFLGHGVQRSFFFTLLQYIGEQRFLLKYSEDSGESVNGSEITDVKNDLILLIIEEPELYQHPNRIKLIKKLFQSLTEPDRDLDFQFQIICSSHSPYLIDMLSVEDVRILRKVKENDEYKVFVKEVDLDEIAQKIKEFYKIPDTKKYDKLTLLSRLISIMTIEISEGFFSDKVVLVEGLEDKAVLLAINHQINQPSFEEHGISIIPVLGKTNLDRPALIFKELEIPTFIIFDTDNDKSGEELTKHEKINTALRKIMEDTNITDAFEQKIEKTWACLTPNLTSFLKEELDKVYYNQEMNKLRELYEFPKIKDCQKNVTIMKEFIKISYEAGKRIPFFEQIIQNIHEL